jgi:NTP pyrophosphatase (non-canonical NTP hydrolase)
MSNLFLKPNPTLADFQQYVKEMVAERGFDKDNVPQKFMQLLEECGEFAKAGRKASNMKIDVSSESFEVGKEAADVLIYLIDICNHFGVDLEKAFREKEEENKKRIWK